MGRFTIAIITLTATSLLQSQTRAEETLLSSILTPTAVPSELNRQSRSYYDYRYGRPFYDRLEYDRGRCGRCYDDDDDDDNDQRDDDRQSRPRSKSKSRYDDDRRIDDRKTNANNNTDDDNDKPNDRPSGSRNRGRNRHRNDDRDRYSQDYYDRFLRDRYRDRDHDRYYDDYYRDRRPVYERYPDRYDSSGRYDYGYAGYRRPYDDRYDDAFGGYGPGEGRGPHGRPWDETYRGLAGWDAGGRGYYFASGRPDTAPASAWGRPETYPRPQYEGWQSGGYRDPLEYRGSIGYGQNNGYRQDFSYGQASGWQSVGERRPYRDESGVNKLNKEPYNQHDTKSNGYGQSVRQSTTYGRTNNIQPNKYGQASVYGQTVNYGQPNTYGQFGTYGQNAYVQSSTTQETSYLFQREDQKGDVKNESIEKTTAKAS